MDREVSWRPEYSRRLFGVFVGMTSDGKVKVKRCNKIYVIERRELTWEVG